MFLVFTVRYEMRPNQDIHTFILHTYIHTHGVYMYVCMYVITCEASCMYVMYVYVLVLVGVPTNILSK